jgi:hypothetical protein
MRWLTWRQHRAEATVGAAVLLGLAAGLVLLGVRARSDVRHLGLSSCLRAGADCSSAIERLHNNYHWLPPAAAGLIALPLLAGMFWGAPLIAREIENGTHRFVWTQSVTRLRWISTKLTLILGATAATALGVGLLAAWTFAPLVPLFGNRFGGNWFDVQGLLPAAYMVFALALGALLGAVGRRTIPAMAVTLVGYAAARLPVHYLRKSMLPQSVRSISFPLSDALQNMQRGQLPFPASGLPPGDWLIKSTLLDSTGHAASLPTSFAAYCPGADAPTRTQLPSACLSKLSSIKLQVVYHYLPAGRFWALQGVEAAIFLVLAAALIAACIVVVVRGRPS